MREVGRVGGEDCDVWRWVPGAPMTPRGLAESSSSSSRSQERAWQGQAFESLETTNNLPKVSPSSCLKIRNMFDSEM